MNLDLRPVGGGLIPLRGKYRGRGVGYAYIQPPDCIPSFPGAIPDPACIALQAEIQQENMAAHDEEQRQIFLDDCNQNWETNDAQLEALGLPRPVNNCALIYPVELRGQVSPTQIPVTYMPPPSAPVAYSPAPAPAPAPVPAPGSRTTTMLPAPPTVSANRGYSPNDKDVFPGTCPPGQSPGWKKLAGTQAAGGFWPDNTIPTASDVCCGVMGAVIKGRRMTLDEARAALASGAITTADLQGAQATFECGAGGGFDWKSPGLIVGAAAFVGFLIWQANR